MLEKFKGPDRARIDVIRHRSRTLLTSALGLLRETSTEAAGLGRELYTAATGRGRRLAATGRGRALLAAATAMVFITGGALAANAAISDGPPTPGVTAVAPDAALADREDAAGAADRGERPDGEPSDPPAPPTEEPAEDPPSEPKADEPSPSPSPEPEPEPSPKPSPKEEPKKAEPKPDWTHPMPGAQTTSCYGWRWGAMHAGVDLAAPHGTPIRAVGAGTVTEAGWAFGGYGISVVIDHHDGHFTHYAHASETRVSRGDKVTPGQIIALEGSTGDSTGPHLHFEVHKGMWNQVEPTQWLSNRNVQIGGC